MDLKPAERPAGIRITTLVENHADRADLCAAHGLSLYIETPRHTILFDAGPRGETLLANADAMGIDLDRVDLAVLSHGHYDHGGGLAAFCGRNRRAPLYIQKEAFGAYYAVDPGNTLRYIGLPAELEAFRSRFRLTAREAVIDGELTLFTDPPMEFDVGSANALLKEKTGETLIPDAFRHEQDLLISAAGRAVLIAGCAHRGIVNILDEAAARLGRAPDAVFGGFHLFELDPADPASDALIDRLGRRLLEGETIYYTGHCTGDYAYDRLKAILGGRLRPMHGGVTAEL